MSLFGSVEYFEKKISKYLTIKQTDGVYEEQLPAITAKLKKELLYDFVCDEKIRGECIENLLFASRKWKSTGFYPVYK